MSEGSTPNPAMSHSAADSPVNIAAELLRTVDIGALATVLPTTSGTPPMPYASLVLLGLDRRGRPLMLLSDLAQHTKNLRTEPGASLLIDGTVGRADRLTGARISLIGTARPVSDGAGLARFVARHPSAAAYAGFGDFHLFAMEIARAHLVAGFGRIHWVEGDALSRLLILPSALAEAEAEIIAHMNEDHADAIALYAIRLLGLPATVPDSEGGPASWRMTGLDGAGIDLRAGGQTARLSFAEPVTDAEQARAELVRLARTARSLTND